jgi:predicted enzyme related to lactoylglutathione lyase
MAHFAVRLVHGPGWDPTRPIRRQDGWDDHAAFMDGLVNDGFIIVGGPVEGGEETLHLVVAEDENEIRTRLAGDPWASADLLRVGAIEPWALWLDGRREPQLYRGGELVVVVDCADLDRAARFWAEVLGYAAHPSASTTYRTLLPPGGRGVEVLLQRVPDVKRDKNRVHLDLRTADLTGEVTRAIDLGASLLTGQPIEEDGFRWHILADPDGNEFCVLQPPAAPPPA